MSGWRGWGPALGSWVVGVVVLFLAVTLALEVPAVERLGGYGVVTLLDYARQFTPITPLSDAYVRRVLHLPSTDQDAAPAHTDGVAAASVGGPGPAALAASSGEVLRHPFTNDDFAHAVPVQRLPFTATTDTLGATRQPGEPAGCAPTGGTAWYFYRATSDAHIFADTFGTDYADSLGVFTGSAVDRLTKIACGSDLQGSAQTGFQAHKGTTYWFQIAGPLHGGRLAFHLTEVGPTFRVGGNMTALWMPALSGNGRWVAFAALPTHMQPGVRRCPQVSTGYCPALFLTDLRTGRQRLLLSVHDVPIGPLMGASEFGTLPRLTDLYLSDDGRYLAFACDDPQLVPNDTNGLEDAFVIDTVTDHLERVSLNSRGAQATVPRRLVQSDNEIRQDGSQVAGLSGDGRYVVFTSDANNLAPGDHNGNFDVFWHDRLTGRTRLVSVNARGRQFPQHYAYMADTQSITEHGRYVMFVSYGDNTCGSAPPCAQQLRVWDARTGRSEHVAPPIGIYGTNYTQETISADGRWLGAIGVGPNNDYRAFRINRRTGAAQVVERNVYGVAQSSEAPATRVSAPYQDQLSPSQPYIYLSADGRYVVYDSYASDLVPADTNGADDVFVCDSRALGSARISLTPTAGQWTTDSFAPQVARGGRVVLYLVDSNAPAIYVHFSRFPGVP